MKYNTFLLRNMYKIKKYNLSSNILKRIKTYVNPLHDAFANNKDFYNMIYNGVDKESVDHQKNTILHKACMSKPYLIEDLLSIGMNINAVNCFNYTPLYYVCRYNPEYLHILLKYGANTNIVDISGNNVLHIVCKYNPTIIYDLIIFNESLIHQKNYNNETPFDILKKYNPNYLHLLA